MYHYTFFLVAILSSVHLTHAFSMQRSSVTATSVHVLSRPTALFYKSKPYEDSAEVRTTTAASKGDNEHDDVTASTSMTSSSAATPTSTTTPSKPKSKVSRVKSTTAGSHVLNVETLQQLKNALDFNKEKVVVVRFFSHHCKSCAAVTPKLNRLARLNPNARFIDIPITKDNPDVQKEMDIYAVPFGHIYYPEVGLVEEVKMSKLHWHDFEDIFYSYVNDTCDVSGLDIKNFSSPLLEDTREYILLKKRDEIKKLKKASL